jgi:hypothetical protein
MLVSGGTGPAVNGAAPVNVKLAVLPPPPKLIVLLGPTVVPPTNAPLVEKVTIVAALAVACEPTTNKAARAQALSNVAVLLNIIFYRPP